MLISPNILIIGANFSNKGAEAMMKTVKQQLTSFYPDSTCYMVCRPYEEHLASVYGFVPVFKTPQPTLVRQWKRLKYRVRGKLYKVLRGESKKWYFSFPFDEIHKIIDGLDIVIDVSGFAYADSWGKPMIEETTKLMRLCKSRGIKFYFLPQAWGSFDAPHVAEAVRNMLAAADVFFARDSKSRQYLAQALGVEESTIQVCPDIVFSFAPDSVPSCPDLQRLKASGKLLIGISPNLRVYERTNMKGENNDYMSVLLSVCSFCMEEMDANLVLIPNETFPEKTNHPDDRHLCEMLYNSLGRPSRCAIINRYASAEEIRSFIGEVDVLVSSRFHALIFGLTQRKPVLAISWSHKYHELFKLFGLDQYVSEADTINDHGKIVEQLRQLIHDRKAIAEKIDTIVPRLQSQVDDIFKGIFGSREMLARSSKQKNIEQYQAINNHE